MKPVKSFAGLSWIALLLAVGLVGPPPAGAEALNCRVYGVTDGDTGSSPVR